jgi:uncharacterized protein YkwD
MFVRRTSAWLLVGSLCVALACACAGDDAARRDEPVAEPGLPAWLSAPEQTERAATLEEAAAMLCARDTHAVVDDEVRRVAGVWEGQVSALVERDGPLRARALAAEGLPALVAEISATHVGVAEGAMPGGAHCVAVVAARRPLTLQTELPSQLSAPEPFPLAFKLDQRARATIFLMRPDGHVERMETEGDKVHTVVDPRGQQGRYVLELIVTGADDAPEVALMWPFAIGAGSVPPTPAVLFGDEGHNDVALTRRTEALVHRLRVEQELPPLKLAPPLGRLARARAKRLAEEGRLGHRLPDGNSAHEELREREPGFPVKRLAEVQAQAGTLEEAWGALLDSPAHRYELVFPSASHLGAAVVRGKDALERPLVTLVLLAARRINVRPPAQVRVELTGRFNLARDVTGHGALQSDSSLTKLAQAHAESMASAGALDDALNGSPVTQRALESDARLEAVRLVKARADDPLRIAPSGATLDGDATLIGVGLVPPQVAGQWYVSILVATVR